MASIVKSEEDKRKAALALNLCMVSISQIIDYEDINILKQEYDSILNNINIQQIIKDEALLNAFRSMLDIITFYLIQEGDKEMAEREYQNRLKNALFDSLPSIGFFAIGDPFSMAIGVATMIGSGYLNYRRSKARSNLDFEKKMWELQRSAIEQLNGLRRSMFETAWRLSETYNFPDEWRLTEKQIQQYNKVLMDPDSHRQYDRMEALEHIFIAFPPFWYFKSRAALETSNKYAEQNRKDLSDIFKLKALDALEKFDEAYFPLMREDIIAASASLDKFSLLNPKKDKVQMLDLLNRAQKTAGSAFDILQLCALNYIALQEAEKAIKILRTIVNEGYNIQLNGRLLSRIYCELDRGADYEFLRDRIGKDNVLPWTKTLIEAREKQLVNSRERLTNSAEALIGKFFAARTQKLSKTMFEQLKAWDDALGNPGGWKEKVANSASFDSWNLKIESELNEAYHELTNDSQFRKFFRTDRDIWRNKIQEHADVSKEAIDRLQNQVKALKKNGETILKDTQLLSIPMEGLLKSPKSSLIAQYVSNGRKLNRAVFDCFETIFEASTRIIKEAFAATLEEVKSENDIDAINEFIEVKILTFPVSTVSVVNDLLEENMANFYIDYFEEKI
jgi:hypothetical protein